MSCGADKVVRLFERSSAYVVLQDEDEEERERQERELATGETTGVRGQKMQVLASRKTIGSEQGVSWERCKCFATFCNVFFENRRMF